LPLRAVENDVDLVVAVQKLHIVKYIAVARIGLGESEQLSVAVDLRFPTGRKVALEASAVEGGLSHQRPIGHYGPAAARCRARKPIIEAFDVAESEMGSLERPEQMGVRVGTVSAQPEHARYALLGRDHLCVVRELRDFAGGIDGALPVDPHAVAGAI